jgi:hypothetical protein
MTYVRSLGLLFLFAACGGSRVSESELLKLDPPLQRLLSDRAVNEAEYDVTVRPDGTKEYGVIIYTDRPEELRAAGVRVNSIVRDFATARVSRDELRSIVSLAIVRAVKNSVKDGLHEQR